MAGRWIRLDTTWSKSKWIAKLPPASRLAWVELLCYMKAHGNSESVKSLCPEVAASEWKVTVVSVTRMLDAALKDGALKVIDGGDQWVLTGWFRQTDTTNALRQQRYRERQKELTEPVTPVTRNVTPVTPTETETETVTTHVGKKRKRPAYTPEFEELWQVGRWGPKGEAFDYYRKAVNNGTDHPTMLAGRQQYIQRVSRKEDQTPQALSRWIRDERWEEQQEVRRGTSSQDGLRKSVI